MANDFPGDVTILCVPGCEQCKRKLVTARGWKTPRWMAFIGMMAGGSATSVCRRSAGKN